MIISIFGELMDVSFTYLLTRSSNRVLYKMKGSEKELKVRAIRKRKEVLMASFRVQKMDFQHRRDMKESKRIFSDISYSKSIISLGADCMIGSSIFSKLNKKKKHSPTLYFLFFQHLSPKKIAGSSLIERKYFPLRKTYLLYGKSKTISIYTFAILGNTGTLSQINKHTC